MSDHSLSAQTLLASIGRRKACIQCIDRLHWLVLVSLLADVVFSIICEAISFLHFDCLLPETKGLTYVFVPEFVPHKGWPIGRVPSLESFRACVAFDRLNQPQNVQILFGIVISCFITRSLICCSLKWVFPSDTIVATIWHVINSNR